MELTYVWRVTLQIREKTEERHIGLSHGVYNDVDYRYIIVFLGYQDQTVTSLRFDPNYFTFPFFTARSAFVG